MAEGRTAREGGPICRNQSNALSNNTITDPDHNQCHGELEWITRMVGAVQTTVRTYMGRIRGGQTR